jgi:tryptophanyl-tRNA synthetase
MASFSGSQIKEDCDVFHKRKVTNVQMLQQAVVTAWEVKGKVDYEKLCAEFGCTPIPPSLVERIEKLTGVPAHPFLKRGVFYAHRDLQELLDLYEKGEKFYLYTGVTQHHY